MQAPCVPENFNAFSLTFERVIAAARRLGHVPAAFLLICGLFAGNESDITCGSLLSQPVGVGYFPLFSSSTFAYQSGDFDYWIFLLVLSSCYTVCRSDNLSLSLR